MLRANRFLPPVGAQEVGLQTPPPPLPPSWFPHLLCSWEGGWQTESPESPVLARGRAESRRRSCDEAQSGQQSGLSTKFWLPPF